MENKEEIWKDIIGYEGMYAISNFQNFKSLERYVNAKNGSKKLLPEKIIIPKMSKSGYLTVSLSKNGKHKMVKLHILIANAFLGEKNDKIVNHINGIKTDNRIDNLEFVTQRENVHHHYISNKKNEFLGICYDKISCKWRAYIRINGKQKYIGRFKQKQEAINRYNDFCIENNIYSKYSRASV